MIAHAAPTHIEEMYAAAERHPQFVQQLLMFPPSQRFQYVTGLQKILEERGDTFLATELNKVEGYVEIITQAKLRR
jgi:hypothetical protein